MTMYYKARRRKVKKWSRSGDSRSLIEARYTDCLEQTLLESVRVGVFRHVSLCPGGADPAFAVVAWPTTPL